MVLLLIAIDRFTGFSRAVFVLDAIFSWALLLTIRQSFPLFRNCLCRWAPATGKERRVFVLGTSEQAELALRYLRSQRIICAGLIDTNGGADLGRWLWGTPVIAGINELSALGNSYGVSELVLPDHESLPCSEMEFLGRCERSHLRLVKLGLFSSEPTQ